MNKQTITLIYDDLKNIKESERLKTQLENKGYTLIKTLQIGLNKFKLIYSLK